jgi:hypothetical protein
VLIRDERLEELKEQVKELKELNKALQSELIKNSYELRAIISQQTTSHPSSWLRSEGKNPIKNL